MKHVNDRTRGLQPIHGFTFIDVGLYGDLKGIYYANPSDHRIRVVALNRICTAIGTSKLRKR